jgi:predicted transglutaminase-like cysteine proteinase
MAPREIAMNIKSCAALIAFGILNLGFAGNAGAGTTMKTAEAVVPPMGFIGFCVKHSSECLTNASDTHPMALTAERRAELDRVQADINWQIKPREDPSHAWHYAEDGYGDCNTYALTKRKALIAMGWPEDTLLLAAVYDELGEGHLVLVARTSEGDLVLDNRLPPVVAWEALPYRWVAMQSQQSPARWVKVVDQRVMLATAWPHP